MTYEEALNFDQKWTPQQAFNDLERYLLRGEKPVMKAVAIGMQALEKQTPKKPHRNYEKASLYWCECGHFLCNAISEGKPNYCKNCGHPIDWSDDE